MKKIACLLLALCCGGITSLQAQEVAEKTIDERINEAISPVTGAITDFVFSEIQFTDEVAIPVILIWLLTGAIVFTIYLRFIQFRGFKHALNIVKGKYTDEDDPGQITHFQALTAALSGTVGLGNIAGVAIAMAVGGPGASFWMIIAGLLGMAAKFVECALAVKYRTIDENGVVNGGPMYYLSRGMKEKGFAGLGKVLAAAFAVLCIGGSFGGGNMFQVNQAASQFISLPIINDSFLVENNWIFGLIMAILVGMVILGGITSIVKVTEMIVPFMVILYVIAAIIVLGVNIEQVPEAFAAIINGAFSGDAMFGGVIGAMIMGFRRAAFSNEAGIGSAAIAHSPVKTKIPVTEGFVGSLEPFVDTVVVCTMTALVIIISGAYIGADINDGIALTSTAFATVIDWFPILLSIAVILFAFSTMISWSYYGLKSWMYLFGTKKSVANTYKLIFCIFIVIGSALNLSAIIGFSDAMIFAMSVPNLIGLYFLMPVVKREMNVFLTRIKNDKMPISAAQAAALEKEKAGKGAEIV
ncbi:alanine/glycine:cation symporter family protein [Nafulsella turpanensis]|uniref:alanine/glycine:cation symporter family protein n=1 Tax=Nafulsella turpanensis TaxID=1265690 RepID=UPI0003478040|nr:alanine/glycine:cation symporter family protein [Nafulsella turpanensis]